LDDIEALEQLVVSTVQVDGITALFDAVGRFGGALQRVESLLADGGNPNERQSTGETLVDALYAGVTAAGEMLTAQQIESLLRRHGYRDSGWSWRAGGVPITVEVCRASLRWTTNGVEDEVQSCRDLECLGPRHALPEPVAQHACRRLGIEQLPPMLAPLDRRLLAACYRCDVEVARDALSAGASVNARDGHDEPALCIALRQTQKAKGRIAAALVALGADTAVTGAGGSTALHLALELGHAASLVGELVCNGAPIEARDARGRTPIHWLAAHWRPDLDSAEWLLQAGARVDVPDHEGATPLMLAKANRGGRKLSQRLEQRAPT